MSTRLIAGRFLCPLLLLVLVGFQFAIGGNALPTWLSVLAQKNGQDPLSYLKILIMVEFTVATVILLLGTGRRMVLSQIAMVVVAFVALAECAAAVRNQTLGPVFVAAAFFVVALSLEAVMLRSAPPGTAEPRATRGMGARLAGVVAMLLVGLGVLANVEIAPRTFSDGAVARRGDAQDRVSGRVIEMNPKQWVGRSLRETPIAQFVPDAIEQLQSDGVLVLYNPRCGTCHDLFEVYFSDEDPGLRIVALEVPPTDRNEVLESEYSGQVNCPSCVFTTLPDGPMWLVGVPYVVRVVDETVTCVSVNEPGDCLEG
ncbi:MAG: hypothetical protein VYD99_03210 [Planctomycetota bacterium]|nr:hypothetical protein [Planctomycetota bacterium]